MLKNAIVLAFFSCGCNQSQIFPRSGAKIQFFAGIKKEFFELFFVGNKFQVSSVAF